MSLFSFLLSLMNFSNEQTAADSVCCIKEYSLATVRGGSSSSVIYLSRM